MKNGSGFFARIALTVFIVFSIIMIVQLQLQFNELKRERDELQQSIDDYEESIAELEYRLALPFDRQYIIKVARDKLNYHLPEEILFYNDLSAE